LAIHYEHHARDHKTAMEFTLAGLERLRAQEPQGRSAGPALPSPQSERFTHRLERLQRKISRLQSAITLPMV
jgi:hypothetical protein